MKVGDKVKLKKEVIGNGSTGERCLQSPQAALVGIIIGVTEIAGKGSMFMVQCDDPLSSVELSIYESEEIDVCSQKDLEECDPCGFASRGNSALSPPDVDESKTSSAKEVNAKGDKEAKTNSDGQAEGMVVFDEAEAGTSTRTSGDESPDKERNKLIRTDADIYQAVNEWCSDPKAAEEKYGHIRDWDVSKVTSMKELFKDKKDFNDDLSRWDVSNVTDMYCMFRNATSFNSDLSGWNVSNVTHISHITHIPS